MSPGGQVGGRIGGGRKRRERRGRILFATSNGTGLGHLNRALAFARRLPEGIESSFLTLSQAAPVIAEQGYEIDYFASYRRPASGSDRAWNMRLRRFLEQVLDERRPDLVVFDGVHPYRALTHVLSARGAPPSVWCRRPLWRAGSPRAPLSRQGAFDAVLEPGELAAAADRGPTVALRGEAFHVEPVVLLDRSELLAREEAAAALGLDPSRRTALVTLGQGDGVHGAQARALAALAGRGDLQVAALQSSIGTGAEVPRGVVLLDSVFPMSRYFNAFDLAVAASGYNAFHELLALGVPALFVPMERNTDDQAARARWAAERGMALAVRDAADPGLEERLGELADPATAERLRESCSTAFPGNGAERGARLLAAMVAGERPAPAVRRRGRLGRWLRLSSHPVGPSLPLSLLLGARELLRHPERRAPYLAIVALGVPDEEIAGRVAAELDGMDPRRVLVLTDSLRFSELRRLGVAFELLPRWPEPGPRRGRELAALQRRLRLLLAGRAPLRARSIGPRGAELLGLADLGTEASGS